LLVETAEVSMKYPLMLLIVAVLAAAGCAQTQDQTGMQEKCAAGNQSSCTELAEAQRLDRELRAARSPIPSPALAIGGVGQ
jgi:hypothetical protein